MTICVMRRSTTRLASDKACRGEKPYSSPISLTISTVAIAAASSRVRLKPNVNQPLLATRAGQRQAQLGMQLELHLHLHGAVERRPGDLPVALHRVSVTRREQRAIDRDRQEQRRAFR